MKILYTFLISHQKYELSEKKHSEGTDYLRRTISLFKKGKRKVQGVPKSQTAALSRPQEEEETDKPKQAQTEQTYEKHYD